MIKRISLLIGVLILATGATDPPTSSAKGGTKRHVVVAVTTPPVPPPIERGTEQTPIFVKGDLVSHPVADPAQIAVGAAKTENDQAMTVATQRMAWLTLVMAVIAGIQVYMFYKQLGLTREALRDSRTAADAAKASAEALPRIERAYVFAEVKLNQRFELNSSRNAYDSKVLITFTNHGKTPAILTRLRAYADYREEPPKELVNHERAQRRIPKGIVVGAGKDYIYLIDVSLEPERFTQIQDVISRIYCLGCIDYEDVLGAQRSTSFCWQSYPQNDQIYFTISPVDELNNFT